MVGIWFLNEWLQAKQPKSVRLVELGPGRGTLMADILRVSIYLMYSDKYHISFIIFSVMNLFRMHESQAVLLSQLSSLQRFVG